jgi:hypothetical protein
MTKPASNQVEVTNSTGSIEAPEQQPASSDATLNEKVGHQGSDTLRIENGHPMDKKSCEVWTGMQWEILPVSAIHPHHKTVTVRCPECHGPVLLMKASSRGRAHFEHRPAHNGCLLAHRYTGTPAKNPNPVSNPTNSMNLAFTDYITDQGAVDIIGGDVTETEKLVQLLARVGQGAFRQRLIRRWTNCSVTDCGPETALVASHIVSWRACETNEERLDCNNGLLLSPNLDKLFDRKLISFSDSGTLLVSPDLCPKDAVGLGLHMDMKLRYVTKEIAKYLARHRNGTKWEKPSDFFRNALAA